ncbi:MAG TPA: spermidine/putrescine ABC transporter substrate-binding protein [Actinomycetes bacterium]|nr:spermidine/putrescine ABC transporter substrate-binding protein [Actinomycetes bacterium]
MTDKLPSLSPSSGIRNTGLSRRGFLRGVGATGAAAAGASLLAACGSDDEGGDTGGSGSDEKILNFANWPLYIDQIKRDPQAPGTTMADFMEETGIEVVYTEPINDNEQYFQKIRPVLAANKDVGVDSFVLTDWMASNLINLGWLEELDKSNIPNFDNLTETLKSPTFDPERTYSLPWQSGVTGIAYDESLTDPITTINDLLTNPDLNGSITALTEMRDTMGLILLDQGADPADFDADQWASALAALEAAKDSGQIRQFTGNNYAQLLAKGDIKACIAWSGDVIQLQFDNPNIKFVIPDAGGMLWSDNMLIPNQAQHKENAEIWMNYYYDPKVAARLAAWVNYICPVDGAQQEMEKIDPSLAKNPLIFPSAEDYERLSIFRALTDDEQTQFSSEFQSIAV